MTYVIVACNRKLLQKEQRKGIRLSRTHVNSSAYRIPDSAFYRYMIGGRKGMENFAELVA
jgi:CRISPR/Cas system CMR-associated protein Cmr3 (group 5 of RAMP superfamily)